MNIVVLDGMGGGIGSRIVGILKEEMPSYIEVYGLGTNSLATASMLKKGANKGATGENAIAVTVAKADFIVGSIAMTIPNSMMGEITPKMVEAVGNSEGIKIYIPILPENHHIVSLEQKPLMLQIREAVDFIKKELNLGDE
ncbi:DUF3842 family protein [Acetobacterium fimetarium]|uniref:DUF3842 family protein n=1 Tax=Acetobacterium fimetarium TaxID=52691 RepID=A0ABR6WSD3_9FIRM|nr:DUF3842 family protein [Acetobacterium fimetarium]MBC3803445.1 DUF3842 family protein [Acetobacterium fimetarium]